MRAVSFLQLSGSQVRTADDYNLHKSEEGTQGGARLPRLGQIFPTHHTLQGEKASKQFPVSYFGICYLSTELN